MSEFRHTIGHLNVAADDCEKMAHWDDRKDAWPRLRARAAEYRLAVQCLAANGSWDRPPSNAVETWELAPRTLRIAAQKLRVLTNDFDAYTDLDRLADLIERHQQSETQP